MRLHGSGHIPQRGECGLRMIFADEAAASYTTSDCLKDCSYEQAVAERRARVRELRQRLQLPATGQRIQSSRTCAFP